MQFRGKERLSITATGLAIIVFLTTAGCSNNSAGANMSADEYKKAAMGSRMSPTEEASMRAAVKKNQEEDAARQAAAKAAPQGPPISTSQPK